MPTANVCCNPLNRKNHKKVYTNIQLVTDNWNQKFKNLAGLFICNACKCLIYKSQNEISFHNTLTDEPVQCKYK